jgi:hypothetical protein
MKIAVALYTQQQLSITPSWLKSDLWIQWEKKAMESSEEDGEEAWVIQTL